MEMHDRTLGTAPPGKPEPDPKEADDIYTEDEDEAGTGDPAYHHRRTRDSQRLRALGTAGAPMAYLNALRRGR